jgi:uncharacterized RDD family membrane protein YckC
MADDESLATKRYLLVAPLFERVVAALVDLGLFIALAWALRATGDDAAALRIFVRLSPAGALAWLAAMLGWSYLSERVTGTTPGKYLLGLVVRSADGSVCTERQIRSRTLWRIVDGWPTAGIAGFAAAATSPSHQRIGDRRAGTVVVRNRIWTDAPRDAPRPSSPGVMAAIALIPIAMAVVVTTVLPRSVEAPTGPDPAEVAGGLVTDLVLGSADDALAALHPELVAALGGPSAALDCLAAALPQPGDDAATFGASTGRVRFPTESTATVGVRFLRGSGAVSPDAQRRWRVSLVRVDGRWLVDAIAVDGTPLTSSC